MIENRKLIQVIEVDDILKLLEISSPLGRKKFHKIKPYYPGQEKLLLDEYKKIEKASIKFKKSPEYIKEIQSYLSHIEDISLILLKLKSSKTLEIFEIFEIKSFIFYCNKIEKTLASINLNDIINLASFKDLFEYLDKDKKGTPYFQLNGSFSESYNRVLSKIDDLREKRKLLIHNKLEEAKNKTRIQYLQTEIVVSRFNEQLMRKIFGSGYYVIDYENIANVKFRLNETSTIYIDEQLQLLNNELQKEEILVRESIASEIKKDLSLLELTLIEIVKFDLIIAKAIFSDKYGCVIPEINLENKIILKNAINIPLKSKLEKKNLQIQPISIEIDKKVTIIIGINMGGKTTLLKLLGQILFLNSLCIPVPCSFASLPLVNFIFNSSDCNTCFSKFANEIKNIDDYIKKGSPGLFLIDEFASSTNPIEGNAFFNAVKEYFLHERNDIVLMTTHFLQSCSEDVGLLNTVGFKFDEISEETMGCFDNNYSLEFLHKHINYSVEKTLVGSGMPQGALNIAKLLGIEKKILANVEKQVKKNISAKNILEGK